MAKLAANNVTYIRIWISSWMFTIEDKATGLGNYHASQSQHWRLDYVMNLCAKNSISVLLCFDYAANFQIEDGWNDNPYNTYDYSFLSSLSSPLLSFPFFSSFPIRPSPYTNNDAVRMEE